MLWASGFLFIKLTGGAVPPLALAACRGGFGAAALALWFVATRRSLRPRGREWRDWAVLGTLNGWGPNVLTAFALTQVTAPLAAMIQASGPIMVAVMAHAVFAEERLSPRRALGVGVGFGGMGVLLGPAALAGEASLPGALAMLCTALSYAFGSLYVRSIPGAEPARLALGQQLFSAGPALALALLVSGGAAFAGVGSNLAPLLALGVVATALPIALYMRLVRAAGPTRASMTGYLLPLWVAILAFVILGESVGPREALGGLVILVGVALVSLPNRLRPGPTQGSLPAQAE